MYNSCISRELTSIYTDFNLLIELQYELEWILYVYSCSISLRNSLGKFFIQNQASSDGAYYQFWWSATYCPNHLVDYRPDLMLIYPFWLQNLSACEQKCKFVLGHYEVLFFKYFIFVRNSIGFAKMV